MPDQPPLKSPRTMAPHGGRLSRRRAPAFPATALDQAVLATLVRYDMPLSAYDLVDRLGEQGRRVVPMSVYRSLERLCARDLVQKVEMLSAYRVKDVARPILMICIRCGSIQSHDASDLHEALGESLGDSGFTPRRVAFEVAGICSECGRAGQS
jgi:Fur family transcriptional regulator, zinc uptake regulator